MPEDQLLFTKRTISAIKEEEKKVSPIPSERANIAKPVPSARAMSEHIVPIPASPKVKVEGRVIKKKLPKIIGLKLDST